MHAGFDSQSWFILIISSSDKHLNYNSRSRLNFTHFSKCI